MPAFVTPGGVRGHAAASHHGTARRLVHRLKYDADLAAGVRLVELMAEYLDPTTTALVPVPRARLRRLRYGIDPAVWLARRLARRSGTPVVTALRPSWWWRPHAASDVRRAPGFVACSEPPPGALLIDDVVTSGATLDAAAAASGIARALTATSAHGSKGLAGDRRRGVS